MTFDETMEGYWVDLLSSYQEANYQTWRCYIVNVGMK